jgi:hypothetical protein
MPLPSDSDKKIRDRFDELIKKLEIAIPIYRRVSRSNNLEDNITISGETVNRQAYSTELVLSIRGFMEYLLHGSPKLVNCIKILEENSSYPQWQPETLLGQLKSLKDEYEKGFLDYWHNLVIAELASDYMSQAQQLLKEGQQGKHNHLPAAVLTGAVLEDTLRRLCGRQIPPLPTVKADGKPKTLSILIDDLKKVGLLDELIAKQLRVWTEIRNAAAHGDSNKFTRQDVEAMILGVNNFLAKFIK